MYIYQVIYYYQESIFCKHEYENEIFSSLKKAKEFMHTIVEDEDRCPEDEDFYFWKIKITQRKLNTIDSIMNEYYYDLSGAQILPYDQGNINIESKTIVYQIGDVVEIKPFPWCLKSPVELPVKGIVGGKYEQKYIVYTFDCFRVIHLHVDTRALKKIELESSSNFTNKQTSYLMKLAKIIKNKKFSEIDLPNYIFEVV